MQEERCRCCNGPCPPLPTPASEAQDDTLCPACFNVAIRVGLPHSQLASWIPLRPAPGSVVLRPTVAARDAAALWRAAQPRRATDEFALRWTRSYTMCRSEDEFRAALERTAMLPAREEYTVTRIPMTYDSRVGFGAAIGYVAFQDLHSSAEFGIWMGSAYRGTGAYQEALAISLIELFEVRGLHRVQWRIHADNAVALNVATNRSGQRPEGRLRDSFMEADGTYRDEFVFGLTRPEWDRAKPLLLNALLYPRHPYPIDEEESYDISR